MKTTYDRIDLEAQKSISSPTLKILLDGSPDSSAPTMTETAASPVRTFVGGPWLAPPRAVRDASFAVQGSQGYDALVDGLQVLATAPVISLVGASGGSVMNDVGTRTFAVSGWFPTGTAVNVQSVVDNVATVVAPNPVFHAMGSGPAVATVPALLVPSVGSSWTIMAVVDNSPPAENLVIPLTNPEIDLVVQGCSTGTMCSASASATIGFQVQAPLEINTTTATVRFLHNMSPDPMWPDQAVSLSPTGSHASGVGKFPVPAKSGDTLQVTAYVGRAGVSTSFTIASQ